jgi:Domain of unknown function (DUF1772)
LVVLAVMGVYEDRYIFPVNERILGMQALDEKEWDEEMRAELERLFDAWACRHWWRVVAPLAAGAVNAVIAVL